MESTMPKKIRKKKSKAAKSPSKSNVEFINTSPMSDIEAPEGFRTVSPTQAIMVYNQPLMEHGQKNTDDLNELMQIGISLWNYSISIHDGKEDKKNRDTIIETLKTKLSLSGEKAKALLDKMVERYSYLFPKNIQPEDKLFMFIRKETSIDIQPLDYSKLAVPQGIIPPDNKDKDLINRIKLLDTFITSNSDYSEFEELMFDVMDDSEKRFEKWLNKKRLSKDIKQFQFPSCIESYLQFIYGYMHDDIVTLKIISRHYIEEFFEDYLLRKMILENPAEYVEWIPALKLFYRFLYEKEYIADPDDIIGAIDSLEPDFIEILRKRFS
jgi:hypothetical protein